MYVASCVALRKDARQSCLQILLVAKLKTKCCDQKGGEGEVFKFHKANIIPP